MFCKKCGIESNDLTWDQDWFSNTGKWRLYDKNMERPHQIVQEQPRVKCPKCDPLRNESWIKRENFQEHIKTAHFGFW
jgi:transposase